MALPVWVGIIQHAEDLDRMQKAREGSSFVICLTAYAETLVFSCPWTGAYNIGSPASRAFRLGPEPLAFLALQFEDTRSRDSSHPP